MSTTENVTKAVMQSALMKQFNWSKSYAGDVVNTLMKVLVDAIVGEKPIVLHGIGTIKPVIRNARTGRNPQTGEEVHIPEKRSVKFKLSKTLEEEMNI